MIFHRRIKSATLWICITGLFMGINIILSSFGIPVPGGHLYICDIIICTAALLLDPFAAFAVGGIGSFLGDMIFYPAPMFVSLVTHGLQAFVISIIAHNTFKKHKFIAELIAVCVGGVILVIGYTIGRAYVYSTPEYAIVKLPYEIAQGLIGIVFSLVLCRGLKLENLFEKTFCEGHSE